MKIDNYIQYCAHMLDEAMDEKGLNSSPNFLFFWGCGSKQKIQKGCLSQWWPCKFIIDGIEYNSAEQYMMAEKARVFNDNENLEAILRSSSPKDIKAFGRAVKNFNPSIWNKVKFDIVVKGNIAKFSQNNDLKQFLISTGDIELVEASPKDYVWGIGLSEDDPRALNKSQWLGQNLLGKALMVTREKIKFNQLNETSSKELKSKQGTTGGKYWCRVGGELGQASISNPLCFSLDPARNYFYYLEKRKANQDVSMSYIVKIDANICDLTNEEDLRAAGLPPSLKIIFEKYGEPYFSINTNSNPRRKDVRYQPKVLRQVIQSIGSKGLKETILDTPINDNTIENQLKSFIADEESINNFTDSNNKKITNQNLKEIRLEKMSPSQVGEGIGSSEEYKAYIELFLAIHKSRGKLKDVAKKLNDVDWLQCAFHHIIAAEFDGFAVSEIFRYRDKSFGTYKDINYNVEGRFKNIKSGTPTFLTINMFTNKGIEVEKTSTGEEFYYAFLKSGAGFKGDIDGNFDKRYDLIIELLTVKKKDRYPGWFETTIDKIEKNYLKSNYAAYNITIKETINEQIETNFNCLLKKQLISDPEQFIKDLLWEKIKENITLSNITLTELFDYFNNCIKININPIQITEKTFLNIIKNSIDYNNKNKDKSKDKNKERRLDIIPFDNKYNYLNIISFDNKNQQNLNNIQKDLYTIINLISEFIQSSMNESQYTKKQIQEAINYWKKQLKIGNYFN